MGRVLLVDGMSVLKTTAGGTAFLTNGFAYNFFTQLTATLKKFPDVTNVIVAWEGGNEHRSRIYPEYKQHREKSSGAEIREQRALVQQLLEHLGIDQVKSEGNEGDDVIAYLARTLGAEALIYSNDRDLLQLVRPGISIYQRSEFSEGKKNLRVEITHDSFLHYTGFPSPEAYLKAKCVMGDDGDIGKNSGLEGVGVQTVRLWATNSLREGAKKQRIEEFLESEKYARNVLLIDLISPRDIPLTWRKGAASSEKALDFLVEVKWPSITKKFTDWWATYKKVQ